VQWLEPLRKSQVDGHRARSRLRARSARGSSRERSGVSSRHVAWKLAGWGVCVAPGIPRWAARAVALLHVLEESLLVRAYEARAHRISYRWRISSRAPVSAAPSRLDARRRAWREGTPFLSWIPPAAHSTRCRCCQSVLFRLGAVRRIVHQPADHGDAPLVPPPLRAGTRRALRFRFVFFTNLFALRSFTPQGDELPTWWRCLSSLIPNSCENRVPWSLRPLARAISSRSLNASLQWVGGGGIGAAPRSAVSWRATGAVVRETRGLVQMSGPGRSRRVVRVDEDHGRRVPVRLRQSAKETPGVVIS